MNCLVWRTVNPEDVHLCLEDENLRAMTSADRQERDAQAALKH